MGDKIDVRPENSISPATKTLLVVAMMSLYSLQSLLITASKSGSTGYDYDPNSVVLMTEFTKALIAAALLMQARTENPALKITVDSNCFKYAIPALLYAVHNNLVFLGLTYLDAPTYQLLNNIKIIGTGLLYRIFLKKPLRVIQWIGLATLMLGQMVATLQTGGATTRPEGFTTGVIVMFVLAAMSGCAGVYNESLLKGSSDSTHWQNLQLYGFSVFFCSLQYLLRGSSSSGFFEGFSMMTWTVILCSATMGQAVSFVLKYTDNITNRFATAASLLLTTGGSYFLFGTVVETPFYLGVGLIGVAFTLYFVEPEKLVVYDSELMGEKEPMSL
eukprot:TRINITY_DN2494_c0_g1_i2.p1 TRINITY_DN2494_c0_g1~~TRINITY_DN2494_c0_g1_i2.p1  ORF type:complete len:331 (-),score=84.15 TRINITY_DN2494_c0_g1_i2:162-1154(-)